MKSSPMIFKPLTEAYKLEFDVPALLVAIIELMQSSWVILLYVDNTCKSTWSVAPTVWLSYGMDHFVRALVAFTKATIPHDFAKKSDDDISFIKYIFRSKCELIYHLLWFALTEIVCKISLHTEQKAAYTCKLHVLPTGHS